jgi:hypothetical protein
MTLSLPTCRNGLIFISKQENKITTNIANVDAIRKDMLRITDKYPRWIYETI